MSFSIFLQHSAAPRIALVAFVDPACAHCAQLAPEFAAAAAMLAETEPSNPSDRVLLGRVDCARHAGIAEQRGVVAFPTLRFYRGGTAVEYTGGRSAGDLVTWVTAHVRPAVRELRSAAQLRGTCLYLPLHFKRILLTI